MVENTRFQSIMAMRLRMKMIVILIKPMLFTVSHDIGKGHEGVG